MIYSKYNTDTLEWVSLNWNQILTSRQSKFEILKTNVKKVGLNILVNRLSALNNKIPLDWLNGSLDSFKVKAKKLLLWNNKIKYTTPNDNNPWLGVSFWLSLICNEYSVFESWRINNFETRFGKMKKSLRDNRYLRSMHCTLFYKHNCACHDIDLQINIITFS